MKHQPITDPVDFDSELDVTDIWQELYDPENEFGETATAQFHHAEGMAVNERHEDISATFPSLVGVMIECGRDAYFMAREEAIGVFGYDKISELEDWQAQIISEQ